MVASAPVNSYPTSASRNRPLSSTVLVSSSMKSGTPSVRATIWSRTSAGSRLPFVMPDTSASPSLRSRRVRATVEMCRWLGHGGVNSGRAVATIRSRWLLDLVDGERQQLQRRRVDPVQILERHQHRLARGEPGQLADQRPQRELLQTLGRHVRQLDSVCRPGIDSSAANSGTSSARLSLDWRSRPSSLSSFASAVSLALDAGRPRKLRR